MGRSKLALLCDKTTGTNYMDNYLIINYLLIPVSMPMFTQIGVHQQSG